MRKTLLEIMKYSFTRNQLLQSLSIWNDRYLRIGMFNLFWYRTKIMIWSLSNKTAKAAETPQNSELIGWIRKNNRAVPAGTTFFWRARQNNTKFSNWRFWQQREPLAIHLALYIYWKMFRTYSVTKYFAHFVHIERDWIIANHLRQHKVLFWSGDFVAVAPYKPLTRKLKWSPNPLRDASRKFIIKGFK